jgi:pantetheine-phosphate adenylyltransferase
MVNNLIVCGGTFDHLHRGHREFLNYAFSIGKKVIIGLTSDEYVKISKLPTLLKLRGASKSQNSNLIEPYAIRKKILEEFLSQRKIQDRVKVLKINDLFGSTLSKDLLINAIVVSEESKKGADIINQKRKELGLIPLKIFIFPGVLAEDGKLISSARIRGGEINKEGKPYVKDLWFKKNLKLTENLRQEFQKPFGELFKNIEDSFKNRNYLVITVGDITTKNFNERSFCQDISVIDFKVAREKKFSKLSELGFTEKEYIYKVNNPAGYITSNLFKKLAEIIKSGMRSKVILQVDGEEDLAVLPLILLSPLNTVIYYGQPPLHPPLADFEGQAGIVRIVVSEESKNKAYSLISKLKTI